MGGLFRDLPPPSDADKDASDAQPFAASTSTSSARRPKLWSVKITPPTLRKPSAATLFAPPTSVLRRQSLSASNAASLGAKSARLPASPTPPVSGAAPPGTTSEGTDTSAMVAAAAAASGLGVGAGITEVQPIPIAVATAAPSEATPSFPSAYSAQTPSPYALAYTPDPRFAAHSGYQAPLPPYESAATAFPPPVPPYGSTYPLPPYPAPAPTLPPASPPVPPIMPPSGGAALVAAAAAVVDEYDSAIPNDYEKILRERKRKGAKEERRQEMERRRREEEEREKECEAVLQRQRDLELAIKAECEVEAFGALECAAAAKASEQEGAASASAVASGGTERSQLHVSGEEAWRCRALLSGRGGGGAGGGLGAAAGGASASPRAAERSPSPPKSKGFAMPKTSGDGLTAAERMMMKTGWKAGQGLGKQEQGITTPLTAKKTGKHGGVIVAASPLKTGGGGEGGENNAAGAGGKRAKLGGVALNGPPSKVVLLWNMVGPGEVDEELEEEVAGECLKYGTVMRVLIFEITDPSCRPVEAVRIFITFDRTESATKALVDLDGRFFGERTLRACFFDEEIFKKNGLAPVANEPPVPDFKKA